MEFATPQKMEAYRFPSLVSSVRVLGLIPTGTVTVDVISKTGCRQALHWVTNYEIIQGSEIQ